MNTEKKFGFATRQIHAGHMENAAGSLCAPIYQTSTFAFSTVQQGGARFAGEEGGYIYTRLGNPTLGAVEEKLASLEGGEAAMAAASGMGAISSALWTSVVAGDEIVADETLYGCTYALLNHGMTKFGVKVTLTDLSDIENLKKNLTDKTRVVYFETPCNPTLKLLDIVIAGIVVGKADFISQCRMFGLKDMTGAVLSPFDAFLMARGLKTLDIRMERHCANAQKVAAFFTSHPAVAKVYYPGLDTFPGHEIAAKQMKLPGGMISIELKADRAAVAAALNKLQLCTIAVSLGDAETLVEHPATMTHSTYSAEELAAAGISEGLVRISVGLEDPEDIIDDFKTVLDTL